MPKVNLQKAILNEKSIFICTSILLSLFFYLSIPVIMPIMISLFIAFLLYPAVKKISTILPYKLTVIIVFLIFLHVIVIFFVGIVPAIEKQVGDFLSLAYKILEKTYNNLETNKYTYQLYGIDINISEILNTVKDNIYKNANPLASKTLLFLSSILSFITYCIIVPLLSVMILIDKQFLHDLFKKVMNASPTFTKSTLVGFYNTLVSYLYAKLLESLILFITIYVILYMFGIEYKLLLAFLVGFSVFIPYVGFILASLPIILTAGYYLTMSASFIAFIVIYFGVQLIDDYVLSPFMVANATSIPATLLMISMIFCGYFLGIIGLIIAAPLCFYIQSIYENW